MNLQWLIICGEKMGKIRFKQFCLYNVVGMLGEAVKNPEMAQRYVNTHTHNTHECKNIFFSKIPLKYS